MAPILTDKEEVKKEIVPLTVKEQEAEKQQVQPAPPPPVSSTMEMATKTSLSPAKEVGPKDKKPTKYVPRIKLVEEPLISKPPLTTTVLSGSLKSTYPSNAESLSENNGEIKQQEEKTPTATSQFPNFFSQVKAIFGDNMKSFFSK